MLKNKHTFSSVFLPEWFVQIFPQSVNWLQRYFDHLTEQSANNLRQVFCHPLLLESETMAARVAYVPMVMREYNLSQVLLEVVYLESLKFNLNNSSQPSVNKKINPFLDFILIEHAADFLNLEKGVHVVYKDQGRQRIEKLAADEYTLLQLALEDEHHLRVVPRNQLQRLIDLKILSSGS